VKMMNKMSGGEAWKCLVVVVVTKMVVGLCLFAFFACGRRVFEFEEAKSFGVWMTEGHRCCV
jgi:hypothetical protein